MKLSECNARQKKAFINIRNAAFDYIGGLELTLMDNPEDTPEYKSAKAILDDHDRLVNDIYNMAINEIYYGDGCVFGSSAAMLRDIRFCGKEWLMKRVEARVKKEGY